MKHARKFLAAVAFLLMYSCVPQESPVTYTITIAEGLLVEPMDGRLMLLISSNDDAEPRFQVSDNPDTQLVYGMDVNGTTAGASMVFDNESFGYPLAHLSDLPEGDYFVQALLHKYETFKLATGHTVKLPMDDGEGQHWNTSPGNLISTPQKVHIAAGEKISIEMNEVIPPIDPPTDTKYIKHVKMKSEKLSKFWGRDIYLGANLLLPEGFDEHPEAHYPLIIFHGHFPYSFGGFRTEPPDEDLQEEYSERFHMAGYNKIQQQEAYDFYQKWTSKDFPRVIIMEVQHSTPYYDDSYAVNSASMGPYGDAITYELVPFIEDKFRGLGEGWSRFTYGGSTGGWEALAVQVMYPKEYNGCFAACPDPIDFRAYTVVNIYDDDNAYYVEGDHRQVPRPGIRDYLGHIKTNLVDMNHRELALGTKSRSGQQWDIWEAVYSPQGEDGYPVRMWDKKTGEIDHEVAKYWQENFDLRYILERDWDKLGPDLAGKINIYCGEMDNYYLNNAVYLMEEFLESTTNPYYGGDVDYGARDEHCWNGDHDNPNAISRLRYNTMYMDKILKRIEESAPKGADLTSWRY
jgi:putative esterase